MKLRRCARVALVVFGGRWRRRSQPMTLRRKARAMSHGWEFSEQGGAELFRNVCAGCHQPDAKGAVGAGAYPSLVADDELASADFVVSVLLGGLKAMPPVGDMMSDAQVADVVNYVRTHFGNAYSGRRFGSGRCGGKATGGRPLR